MKPRSEASSGGGTWLSSVLLLAYRALERKGIDAAAVAARADLSPADLHEADRRIDLSAARRFWVAAVHASGDDPCFGLDVAEQVQPNSLHAVGFAWMASASLREAAARLIRYLTIVNSVDRAALREDADASWLVFVSDEGYSLPRSYDARIAILVRLCRALLGQDFVPHAVRLAHAAPPGEAAARFAAFYRVTPEWGAAEYALGLGNAALDAPVPAANTALALSAEQVALDYLARHTREDIVARVRQCLVELLPSGKASRRKVASRLALSERTLQRRLADAGESFADLLEDLRRDLALDYLRESHSAVNEVAYLLGFAEVASFTRAFRRWTGQTPSAWREARARA